MASRSLGTLTIDLVAKTGLFEKGMDRAARTASQKMSQIERQVKKFGTIGGIAIGGAIATGIGVLVRNTIQAEQAIAQLDAILKSTGEAAGYTRDQLIAMATEFQKSSTFGSTEIIEAQTRLLSYSGILGENIPRAMQSVMDQATRLNMSLSQSAETIGRALESPAKAAAALAQQGFGAAFTKEVRATIDALVAAGREADAQIMILEILEESYGGAAASARNTFGGALEALKHTLSDVLTGQSGSLEGLTDGVNDLIDALNDPEFRRAAERVVSAFFWLAKESVDAISPLKDAIEDISNMMRGVGIQAEATGRIIAGAFRFSAAEIKAAAEEYKRGTAIFDQGFQRALNGSPANPFRNVRSSVQSTYDRPRTVDTTGLDISGEASKARKAAMTDEERAAQRLQSAYESLMGSMHQRIELFGKEGEAARVRYEIEHGSLKGISDALAQQAIQRAEQLDHMEQMERLQKAAAEAADAETRRISEGLESGRELLDNLRFELELMKMTNAERATAIQLRGLENEAVEEYGDAIADLNRKIEAEIDQMRFMDGMRSEFSSFITDVVTGTESITDAFKSMMDNIARMITQMIAERWVEQLFGGQGTTGTGSSGGWIAGLLGALFGGGKAGGGMANPRSIYEVNERGFEMASVNGRDYMLTGGKSVEITPNHRLGGGAPVTQIFNNPIMSNIQTDQQRAREEAKKAQRASARLS